MIVRQEVVLFIMGMIVIETLSVMLQVTYYKYTKKDLVKEKILKMAPLHHHFEEHGRKLVVVRFWIITMILVLIGLATMKIR